MHFISYIPGVSALNQIQPEHPVYKYFVSYHNHSNVWFTHNNRDVNAKICTVYTLSGAYERCVAAGWSVQLGIVLSFTFRKPHA